jgi:hypothetical protein
MGEFLEEVKAVRKSRPNTVYPGKLKAQLNEEDFFDLMIALERSCQLQHRRFFDALATRGYVKLVGLTAPSR